MAIIFNNKVVIPLIVCVTAWWEGLLVPCSRGPWSTVVGEYSALCSVVGASQFRPANSHVPLGCCGMHPIPAETKVLFIF